MGDKVAPNKSASYKEKSTAGDKIALNHFRHSFGFSLVELLVVIAIISLLMAMMLSFYGPSQEQRKVFECQSRLQSIHRALKIYMMDWEGFPASPYDSIDNDRDEVFDEERPDGRDNDGDKRVDEDLLDASVGGLFALKGYLRTRRAFLCPADISFITDAVPMEERRFYSSYQGCDHNMIDDDGYLVNRGDFPVFEFPITSLYFCTNSDFQLEPSSPTYSISRFPKSSDCHPSDPDFDACSDSDKLRQLGIRNTAPYFPNPTFPSDDTVIIYCAHHRYIPHTLQPVFNYTKSGLPTDVVLYWDGTVRLQQMRIDKTQRCPPYYEDWCPTPEDNWRRKPHEQ